MITTIIGRRHHRSNAQQVNEENVIVSFCECMICALNGKLTNVTMPSSCLRKTEDRDWREGYIINNGRKTSNKSLCNVHE